MAIAAKLYSGQVLSVFFASLLSVQTAFADEAGGVTPYRPSLSNPAQLSSPGQLELELGGLRARGNDVVTDSTPMLLKLAFNPAWGLLVGGQVYTRDHDAKTFGDINITLKHAFLVSDKTAFGIELTTKLPTAAAPIGSGKADFCANGIYSQDIAKVHMDANVTLTRLGHHDIGLSRLQTALSAAFSVPVSEHFGLTAEPSAVLQRGAPTTAQMLAALTFSPARKLVFDIGVAKGLNSNSQGWSVFAGVVLPLAKLW